VTTPHTLPVGRPDSAPTALPYQRLYVNIDHVATVRQARRGVEPDPVAAARICEAAGADGITAHLREDRRHIQDDDVHRLAATITTVLNLECAATEEMLALAERIRPHAVTLVPERRQEVTTEGGLDLASAETVVGDAIARLRRAGIKSSLFIDATADAVRRSHALGADAIELHTGPYCHHADDPTRLAALTDAARVGASLDLFVHAGHGLSRENVGPVSAIPEIEELNIGHAIVGRAIFVGIAEAIGEIRRVMDLHRRAMV
jgi:pyridoxine 5-phosphate synthase